MNLLQQNSASAIEMLFAAKVVHDKKLAEGFIHSLDEYKHCFYFHKY